MKDKNLSAADIDRFRRHLIREEKSESTVEKYVRDARRFIEHLNGAALTKEKVVDYKKTLIERGYAARSVNSMLASVNSLLKYLGNEDCCVKNLRTQRQAYASESSELTKSEYLRIVEAARNDTRLCLLIQTICCTGIRVSELRHFTVEAVNEGEVRISCKGKVRRILLPEAMCRKLKKYAQSRGITEGVIFRTRSGRPMDRSNIWAQMKRLCGRAQVDPKKVFPHNLRKLFARTFYEVDKDIAKLADILGHGSIETTRIYIMTTGKEHRRRLEKLGLVV